MSIKIKKGDTVKVISGKNRGKIARVLKAFPGDSKVVVEGVNVVKRHRRPRREGEKGQTVQLPSPIHVSNLLLVCPSCSAPQRTKFGRDEGGRKIRVCGKCSAPLS